MRLISADGDNHHSAVPAWALDVPWLQPPAASQTAIPIQRLLLWAPADMLGDTGAQQQKGTGLRDEWSCCCQRLGSIWTAAALQTDGGLKTNGLYPLLLSLRSPFIHLKTEEIIYSLCFNVGVWVLELKKQS